MNDNELIYLSKTEGLKNAKKILNEKYLAYVNNLQKRSKWNFDHELSKQDHAVAYINLNKSLIDFNIKQVDPNFRRQIALTCKSFSLNNLRKCYTHKRRVDSKSYDYGGIFNLTTKDVDFLEQIHSEITNNKK